MSLAGVLDDPVAAEVSRLLASFRLNGGDLLVILSMAMWSIYTIGLRWRPAGLHMLTFLFVLMVVGDPRACCRSSSASTRGRPADDASAPRTSRRWSASALFSSVLALHLLEPRRRSRSGASVAGLFVHLMPVFGVVLAWIFLGERLALFHVAGIALILTGIWITSRLGRRPAPMPAGTD